MTSKTKNTIGHAFILATLLVISYCLYNISKHSNEIRVGREEVLNTISGKELIESSVTVTYKYAHGLDIHHANELPDDSKVDPDFIISDGTEEFKLVYIEKEQIATIGRGIGKFKVKILKNFDGNIVLMNNVCGCEGLVNLMYFVGGLIVSLILVILAAGFYYSAKHKAKDLILPEKENWKSKSLLVKGLTE